MIDTPKIEVKVFASQPSEAGLSSQPSSAGLASQPPGAGRDMAARLVPVFHRWIREALLGELLIDVADYSHVPDGPALLLVCDGAIYAVDDTGGERGLLFSRRREPEGSTADFETRLRSAVESALRACALLEEEPSLNDELRFDAGRWSIKINDRRYGADHRATLETVVRSVAAAAGAVDPSITPDRSDDRLGVRVEFSAGDSRGALAALQGGH